jgi:putative protein kinase ArgK-like GTPase of G3E family
MQTLVKAAVIPPVHRVVAVDGRGVDELLHTILTGPRNSKREAFWAERLRRLVHERLDSRLGRERFEALAAEVAQRHTDPFTAADGLIDEVLK